MTIDTIGKKFVHDLAHIYDAEHHFLQAQEQMQARADSTVLREMIAEHIGQTRQQIANLETIYTIMGAAPIRGDCAAARGLVQDGDALMDQAGQSAPLLDAAIASAVTAVEHFEVACYRGLIATAEHFEQPSIVDLLRRNLGQEESAAAKAEDGYRKLLHYAVSTQKLQAAVGDQTPLL